MTRVITELARLALVCALLAPTCATEAAHAARPDRPHTESDSKSGIILRFDGDTMPPETFARLEALGFSPSDVTLRRYNTLVVPADDAGDTGELSEQLAAIPGVRIAAESGIVSVQEVVPPNDPHYYGTYSQREYFGPTPAFPHSINLEPLWDVALNGSDHVLNPFRDGVTVAIIDTGVNATLRENTGEYVGIWDYVNNDGDPSDDYPTRHGTLVASMLRAEGDNGWGLAGSMYGSSNTVLVYKTVGTNGNGEDLDTMEAMMDAADRGARVINVSLGGSVDGSASQALLWNDTVNYCTSRGALVVAAAGNYAQDQVLYPAAAPNALAVGALSRTGSLASFSNYGAALDVVAMGERIWGAYDPYGGEQAVTGDGTSFSTPLVTGVASYLFSLMPSLSPSQVTNLLTSTAVDYPLGANDGRDNRYGYGRIDAFAAYQALLASTQEHAPVIMNATSPTELETTVSWSAVPGTNVFYRYGIEEGASYITESTSGRLPLPSDGTHTVFVEAYSDDRWPASQPSTLAVVASSGFEPLDNARLSDRTRYGTAASISQASYPSVASAVVIASGQNWPDALAAGPLATTIDAPLLLTGARSLPVETRDEILRLDPSEILIIGGTGAVSDDVMTDIVTLTPGASVRRIGGSTRYDTARLVASELAARLGGAIADHRAVVVSGQNYPDALSGSPLAGTAGWPILLTRTSSLPPETSLAIQDLHVTSTLVLGGAGAVNDSVLAGLPNTERVSGATRYETSRAVVTWGIEHGIYTGSALGIATGRSFPDALAAGVHLGEQRSPVLLVDSVTWGVDAWLHTNTAMFDSVIILGGTGVLTQDTAFDALRSLRRN